MSRLTDNANGAPPLPFSAPGWAVTTTGCLPSSAARVAAADDGIARHIARQVEGIAAAAADQGSDHVAARGQHINVVVALARIQVHPLDILVAGVQPTPRSPSCVSTKASSSSVPSVVYVFTPSPPSMDSSPLST